MQPTLGISFGWMLDQIEKKVRLILQVSLAPQQPNQAYVQLAAYGVKLIVCHQGVPFCVFLQNINEEVLLEESTDSVFRHPDGFDFAELLHQSVDGHHF